MKNKRTVFITQAAIIAAMYATLTYAQNFLLPGTTSMAIQFRASEALNVLALFTPAAIPGLTIGCVISNLYNVGGGLPLDMVFGTLATLFATICVYLLRKIHVKGFPFAAMLMPALWNGAIVGWEIEHFYIEGDFEFIGFLTQGGLVFLGELLVMFTLGTFLYSIIKKRKLNKQLLAH